MYYKLLVYNEKLEIVDQKLILASGKRLAILKFLRKTHPKQPILFIKIETEDEKVRVYRIEQIFTTAGKFVNIHKVKKLGDMNG
jgi:hypothetical protein